MMAEKTITIQFLDGTGIYKVNTLQFPYIIAEKNKKITIDTRKEYFEMFKEFIMKYVKLTEADKKLFDNSEQLAKQPAKLKLCIDTLKITLENTPQLLKLADILKHNHLINILSVKIGKILSGKSVEEIRKVWGIKDDLSEETKKEIALENDMLEDKK
jgi:hypothetical protein